jgi:hypothetical protein
MMLPKTSFVTNRKNSKRMKRILRNIAKLEKRLILRRRHLLLWLCPGMETFEMSPIQSISKSDQARLRKKKETGWSAIAQCWQSETNYKAVR